MIKIRELQRQGTECNRKIIQLWQVYFAKLRREGERQEEKEERQFTLSIHSSTETSDRSISAISIKK